MRTVSQLRLGGIAFFLALSGCGIGVVGAAAEGGGQVPEDGGVASDAAAPVEAAAPVARCADLPPAWGLVAAVAGGAACPEGYTAGKTDLYAEPTPRADACTCGCKLDVPPTCAGGPGASYDNDNSNSCGSGSSYAWASGMSGACATDMWPGPYTTNHDWKFAPATRQGGTCSVAADKHVDRIDFGQTRSACVPNAGCEAAPPVPAPAKRCVLADGDAACPAAFTDRSVLAKGYDLACTAACACGVEGTCGSGKVTLFQGTNCTGTSFSIAADGTCASSTGTIGVQSYRFSAALSGAGCSATGTASASGSTPIGTMTLCCE
jgi:hypothetical protein